MLLIIYGIPTVGKVASFVSGLRGGNSPIAVSDNTPPAPPNFAVFPDFTNQQYINLRGNAEPGATVKLDFNGASQETVVDKDGNFSFQNLSLKDGANTFSAVTVDSASNISQRTLPHIITYDSKPPDLSIDSPSDGSKFFGLTQRQINIQGSTEASASVTINDRIVSLDGGGHFQYPVTLNSGDNIFTVKSVDQAGNSIEKQITLNFSE